MLKELLQDMLGIFFWQALFDHLQNVPVCEGNLRPDGVLDLDGSEGCREAEEGGREESKDKDSHALAAGVQVTRSS